MDQPRPIGVLIVDDDLYVRESLSDFLASAEGIHLVGVCADGAAAVAAVGGHRPDVVLMDVRMPVMDGLQATRAVLELAPEARVLVLTSFEDDDAIADMFAAGACGFLLKSTRPRALADAIRAAHAGLTLVPPDAVRRWSDSRVTVAAPTLTERERQVLDGLGQGLTNRDLARSLFLSASTVKGVVSSLMRKLDAPTRTRVVARAHELGLLSARPTDSWNGQAQAIPIDSA